MADRTWVWTGLKQRPLWEWAGGVALTMLAVSGGAIAARSSWPAAILIGLLYLGLYALLWPAVREDRIHRLRRLLLIGWGILLEVGLVVAAVLIRGTTAYTPEVWQRTVGTPICNIGNLWILTGLLTRKTMLLGTTMLGFLSTTAAWLGLTLAFGRGWCGWFCYLGVPCEIAARLRRRRGRGRLWRAIRRNTLPPHLGHFRYAILLSAVLLSIWLITPAFCWICPIRVLFDQWELRFDLLNAITAGTGILLFLGTMVVGPLLTGKRVWCIYFCPLGAVTSLLSWLRARLGLAVVSARVSARACQRCNSCVQSCPFNLLSPAALEEAHAAGRDLTVSPECTACGECVAACPEGVIALTDRTGVVTRPAVRRRAYVLALTYFVFLTAFLWAQFVPMFMPR